MGQPVRRLALLAVLLATAAGCGSGAGKPSAAVETTKKAAGTSGAQGSLPAWAQPYLAEKGPEVALVFSTSDYGEGENRVGFLVVRNDGSLVQAPKADVYVGPDGPAEPVRTVATLEPVGPHTHAGNVGPHDHVDATDLYVVRVQTPSPGRYWVVVQPEGKAIQGIGTLDVRPETITPPVGSKAIASDNPTLANASAAQITTASPPDSGLLRYSIADSIEAHVPFVAVFATPKYCQSRTCGPTVEVVDRVRRRIGPSVRFIHIEIYQDNDPQKGPNRWVGEWKLPTEPWVFLVGGDGVIKAKFEGSVDVGELEAAVRKYLL